MKNNRYEELREESNQQIAALKYLQERKDELLKEIKQLVGDKDPKDAIEKLKVKRDKMKVKLDSRANELERLLEKYGRTD